MSRKLTLLAILEAAGDRGVTTGEILQAGVGSRYGARLLELRKEHYVIEAAREREGSWRYRLLDSPEGIAVAGVAGTGRGGCPPAASPQSLFESPVESEPHWAA